MSGLYYRVIFLLVACLLFVSCSQSNNSDFPLQGDACYVDLDCGGGRICIAGACKDLCSEYFPCPDGQYCDQTLSVCLVGSAGGDSDGDTDLEADELESAADGDLELAEVEMDTDSELELAESDESTEVSEESDQENNSICQLQFDYEGYDFGLIKVGEEAYKTFKITYHAVGDCPQTATLKELHIGAVPHFALVSGEVTQDIKLIKGGFYLFTIKYAPLFPANTFSSHNEVVMLVSDIAGEDFGLSEMRLSGTADSSYVMVYPNLDISARMHNDACVQDSDCESNHRCLDEMCVGYKNFYVLNFSDEPFTYVGLEIDEQDGDTGCEYFVPSEDMLGTVILPGDHMEDVLYYKPMEVSEHHCHAIIKSSLSEAHYLNMEINGKTTEANNCPIARISLQSHGAEVTQRITGLSQGTQLCFYGNISYDPDGDIPTFTWDIPVKPEGAVMQPFYMGTAHNENICMEFPLAGDYQIELTVTDAEACVDTQIVYVQVDNNQDLDIILNFEAGDEPYQSNNMVDMDLSVGSSVGAYCSAANMDENNICNFPFGHGSAIILQYSDGAGLSGTTEHIRILNQSDGVWYIKVAYANDCMEWNDILVNPICSHHLQNAGFELKIYDANTQTPDVLLFPPFEDMLKESGDSITWRLVRINGNFQAPVLMD